MESIPTQEDFRGGFYWNLEFPWQVVREVVHKNDISALSEKIKDWGQQFIWIPYAHEGINLEHTDIKVIAEYFTYVFAQPNYYQGKTNDFNEWSYLFKSFKNGHALSNLFVEMECDSGVQRGKCFDNKSAGECMSRACEYVKYFGNYPQKAYYYGTDIQNLVVMKEHCPGYID